MPQKVLETQNQIFKAVVEDYVSKMTCVPPYDIHQIESDVLKSICFEIQKANVSRSSKFSIPKELPNAVIADLILSLYPVRRLQYRDGTSTTDDFDLAIYQYDGRNEGLYTIDKFVIMDLIQSFNYNISDRNMDTVIRKLTISAQPVMLTMDPNLIAVNNGIFDYKNKKLIPFSPDYVFVTKSNVDYNPDAHNVTIHNNSDGTDWDVESWISELSDDPEVVNLLWQVIGAVIRPNIRWDKAVCFYSERGNNGKGTLCALLRNLCGPNRCAAIPFDKFGHEFMLEQLTHVSAIIVDENTTKSFNKETGALKAIITNDCLSINRKYKSPITISFKGVMVQCINDLPKFSDKSESLYRRFLFVPFDKCFTGNERKYIKSDYLCRKDVLEYVLFKVLNMNYYKFDEPEVSKQLLDEYKTFNDPIRDFLNEVLPQFTWSLVPYGFMYDLYKAWFKDNCPSGQISNNKTFVHDLKQILTLNADWYASEIPVSTHHKMDAYEPLIIQYHLTNWMNSNYKGDDPKKLCAFARKGSYRGICRN